MASHSFGHQRSWGTFSYRVFWCISCLTGQHLACLFTEWTPASPAKSIVSQTKPRSRQQTSFDAKSHEAWIWGFTMDLPCFTRVREICHVGNIWKRRHSGTWHWELRAEQRDSKIEGGSSSHFRMLIFEHLQQYQQCFIWFSWPMSWKPKFALLALHGLSASWYQSGQCNDTTSVQETDFGFPSNLTLTKPSVQLELLPVYCFIVSLRGSA